MKYSEEKLWALIRQADSGFGAFTERGGSWRDWQANNPPIAVEVSKGLWQDFRSGEGGTLYSLAKSLRCLPERSARQDKQLPTPVELWQQATRNDQETKRYLSQHRKIPEKNYKDVLNFFRLGKWYGKPALIQPFFSLEEHKTAHAGDEFKPLRVQLILLNENGNKLDKKHRGQTGKVPVCPRHVSWQTL